MDARETMLGTFVASREYTGEAQSELALGRILGCIRSANGAVGAVAEQLSAHADRLHGAYPKTDSAGTGPTPVRSGMLGEIDDALDHLERIIGVLKVEADRNCTLA